MTTFFFSIMVLFLFQYPVVRWISWDICHIMFILNHIQMFPMLYLKADLDVLYLSGRNQVDYRCTLHPNVTVDSICQCAKNISSWVRKVLSILKAHMSRCYPKCCNMFNLGSWGFQPQLDSIFHQPLLQLIGIRIPCNKLCWALVSKQLISKC